MHWFDHVHWEERDITVQCLVDISIKELTEGYYLINRDNVLSILAANQLSKQKEYLPVILGQAVMWDRGL